MAPNATRFIRTRVLLEIDPLALVDHAAMAIDFKGEGSSGPLHSDVSSSHTRFPIHSYDIQIDNGRCFAQFGLVD